jgi:P27 family predicted phage terminase small subunit
MLRASGAQGVCQPKGYGGACQKAKVALVHRAIPRALSDNTLNPPFPWPNGCGLNTHKKTRNNVMKTALKLASSPKTKKVTAPKGLDPELKPLFLTLANHLSDIGFLNEADVSMLVNYCYTQRSITEAQKILDRDGPVVESPHGVKQNPAVSAIAALTSNLTKLGAALGIGPAARKRISAEAAAAAKSSGVNESPWAVQ